MNGPQTPAFTKSNAFTRLIERAAQQNAAEGKPAGRMIEQMATATPVISAAQVRRMTPEQARRTDFIPEPEDPRVAMMASARASALGISNDVIPREGDDLPEGLGHVDGDMSDAEIDRMLARASGKATPGVQAASEGAAAPSLLTGAEAAQRAVTLPRGDAPRTGMGAVRTMPNFANVEGFDLKRKVAVVDGMEFEIASDDVVAMKKFAIQVVLDNVTYQLAQALVALGVPQEMAKATADKMRETAATAADATPPGGMRGTSDGASAGASTAVEAVQKVREGEGAGAVLPGSEVIGQADNSVPGMREDLQYLLAEEEGAPEVPPHVEGSGEQPAEVRGSDGTPDAGGSVALNGEASAT